MRVSMRHALQSWQPGWIYGWLGFMFTATLKWVSISCYLYWGRRTGEWKPSKETRNLGFFGSKYRKKATRCGRQRTRLIWRCWKSRAGHHEKSPCCWKLDPFATYMVLWISKFELMLLQFCLLTLITDSYLFHYMGQKAFENYQRVQIIYDPTIPSLFISELFRQKESRLNFVWIFSKIKYMENIQE